MANMLCIYENKIATVASMENFFIDLARYDVRIRVKFLSVLEVSNEDLRHCDILCMVRPNHPVFGRIAKTARSRGITVLFFLDDDLLHLPKGNADMPWRKKGLLLAAENADVIFSTSPYICKNYGEKAGVRRTFVIDTAVSQKDIKQHEDRKNDRIKIVYAAGIAHKALFDDFIRPILKELDDNYGDRISLTFMGVHPELDAGKYRMPIHYIEPLPLLEYRKRIEKENFDIGLAPLVSDAFTKCKYFNKFIEYSMFGIVCVYSYVEPYTFIIQDQINGLFAGDRPQDWYNTIAVAIERPELIKKCRENSYRLLRERFDAEMIMNKFLENVPELIGEHIEKEFHGFRICFFRYGYGISRIGEWIYKLFFYLKHGGISEVHKAIKRHVKVAWTVRS